MPAIGSLRLTQYPRSKTRFYLPSTGVAAVSPGFDAAWEETGSADRLKMVTTRINSAMADKSITTLITAGDALVRQYVSDALQAQTINQVALSYARTSEALATVDAVSRMVLKVVSNDGSTVRGTLLSFGEFSSGGEWNTSLRNKAFANGDFPTSVAAQDGDRLVLELGFNHAAVISSAAINFGDDSASDLEQDEVATTANNPWLEIGQALLFQAGGTTYDVTVLFNRILAQNVSGALEMPGSVGLVNTHGLTGAALQDFLDAFALLRTLNQSQSVSLDMNGAVSLGSARGLSLSGVLEMLGSVGLVDIRDLTGSALADFLATAAILKTLGFTDSATLDMLGSVGFTSILDLLASLGNNFLDSVGLNRIEGLATSAVLEMLGLVTLLRIEDLIDSATLEMLGSVGISVTEGLGLGGGNAMLGSSALARIMGQSVNGGLEFSGSLSLSRMEGLTTSKLLEMLGSVGLTHSQALALAGNAGLLAALTINDNRQLGGTSISSMSGTVTLNATYGFIALITLPEISGFIRITVRATGEVEIDLVHSQTVDLSVEPVGLAVLEAIA